MITGKSDRQPDPFLFKKCSCGSPAHGRAHDLISYHYCTVDYQAFFKIMTTK